ncbi:MAG: YdeI/OmpD-associated family protein [Chitinophagales bacterium]
MNPLHKKLRLKEGNIILALNKPADFEETMGALPAGAKVVTAVKTKANHLYWFVKNVAELKGGQQKVLSLLKPEMLLWIFHPKGSSGLQTDLTRDKGWESLQAVDTIAWVSYISFNDTWTAVALRLKTEADKRRLAKPQEQRLIYQYADSKTKTIRLPEDLNKALNKNKPAKKIWDTLAFSHRREYVEWIITAKRTETREGRVYGTIERLLKGQKNPTGR